MGYSVYYGIAEGTPPESLLANIFIKSKDGEMRMSPICADDIAHVEKELLDKFVKTVPDIRVQYVEEEDLDDFIQFTKTCKRRKRKTGPYFK